MTSHDTRAGRRRNQIGEQFFSMRRSMLEHHSFRVLSLSAYRVLFRIAIELRRHGGNDNGKLPITYDDFEKYGIHRHAIAPAIRELIALGFIRVKPGKASAADFKRKPSLYLLTCEPTDVEMDDEQLAGVTADNDTRSWSRRTPTQVPPTHDWKGRATTMAQAERLARQARQGHRRLVVDSANTVVSDSATRRRHLSVADSTTTRTRMAESTTTLDISHGGGRSGGGGGSAGTGISNSHSQSSRSDIGRARTGRTDTSQTVVRRRISRQLPAES